LPLTFANHLKRLLAPAAWEAEAVVYDRLHDPLGGDVRAFVCACAGAAMTATTADASAVTVVRAQRMSIYSNNADVLPQRRQERATRASAGPRRGRGVGGRRNATG